MTQMMVCPRHKECSKDIDNQYHCGKHTHLYGCGRHFHACPPCIPYREFHVGDTVRVISTDTCWNTNKAMLGDVVRITMTTNCLRCGKQGYYAEGIWHDGDLELIGGGRELKVGDRVRTVPSNSTETYTIAKIEKPGAIIIKEHPILRFDKSELELITEGDMEKPKYQTTNATRNISNFYATMRKNDCNETLEHLFDLIMTLKPATTMDIIRGESLVQWAEKDPKRIEWLLEKGYIEEAQSAYDKWVAEMPSSVDKRQYIEWAKRMPRQD